MKKIYLSLFFSIFFLITWAQPMERLQQGKLENGLTYYIKHSELQPGQVSFYLVQNVGAILENDSENGLAHFLEHMAFNGTEHFPNELMPYLRNEGIYTFNAHTPGSTRPFITSTTYPFPINGWWTPASIS